MGIREKLQSEVKQLKNPNTDSLTTVYNRKVNLILFLTNFFPWVRTIFKSQTGSAKEDSTTDRGVLIPTS